MTGLDKFALVTLATSGVILALDVWIWAKTRRLRRLIDRRSR